MKIEETQLSGTSSRLGLDGEEPEPPSLSKARPDEPDPIKKENSRKRNNKIRPKINIKRFEVLKGRGGGGNFSGKLEERLGK